MSPRSLLALAVLVALAPARAGASPIDTLGMGSRSIGRAGAVTADVDDFSANYYNPAGLARSAGLRLDLGYVRLQSGGLEINGERSNVEPLGGLQVGLVAPGQFGRLRFAFGLALLLNDHRLSRTRTAIKDRPRWELYDTRMHKVFLAANLALRPTEWLVLGGGITFQAPSELALVLEGETGLVPASARLEHMFTGDLRSIRYPQVGVQVLPVRGLSIGITYRGKFVLENTVRASADVGITGVDLGLMLDLLNVSRSHYGPQQVAAGASYVIGRFRASVELTWIDWSKHPSLISDDAIELALHDPSGFAESLGIEIPSDIGGNEAIPLGARDIWVPRVGAEGTVFEGERAEVTVRGGYAFERSPFPAQRGVTNFIDNDRHTLTVGAEVGFDRLEPLIDGSVTLSAHFLYARLPERAHVKTSLVDPVGDLVSRGNQFGFGTQLSVKFE